MKLPHGALLSEVGGSLTLTTCLFTAVRDYQYGMSTEKFYEIVDRDFEQGLFVPRNPPERAVAREAQAAVKAATRTEIEEAASLPMQGQTNNYVTANIYVP